MGRVGCGAEFLFREFQVEKAAVIGEELNAECALRALLLVGATGLGKSSLAMQLMIKWSLGQAAFELEPARPLKSLLIQAENDDGDLAEMKFGVFLELAKAAGFSAIATGHYARRYREEDDSWGIMEAVDKSKDQSYFLALLRQHQIADARFPVGDLHKSEVRNAASKFNLVTAGKKDSQGICFIGEVKMRDFLRAFVPDNPGPIRTRQGMELGRHKGLHLYTLGQRRGVGVPSDTHNEAYVVVEKRFETNELIVAFDRSNTEGLYARRCRIGSLSYTNKILPERAKILAKPRYRAKAVPLLFEVLESGSALVEFDQSQRALTPGQICALYDGEQLLGGGVFEEIF